MRNPLHIRSFIAGLILGAGLLACLGAAGVVASATPNRFTIATNESHVFVLDTVTGQVWEEFAPNGSGQTSDGFSEPKIRIQPAKLPPR